MISIKSRRARLDDENLPQAGQRHHQAASRDDAEFRCGCGSLLAKLVGGAVELKCRRCKRTWRVPLEQE